MCCVLHRTPADGYPLWKALMRLAGFYIIAVIGLGIAVYSFKDSNKHSKTVDEERKQENITGE